MKPLCQNGTPRFLILTVLVAVAGCVNHSPRSGWVSLFNGKDLTGWSVVGTFGHLALQLHSGDELKIRFKDIWLRAL